MQIDQLKRIESRLIRIEQMLTKVVCDAPPAKKDRLTEKEVIAEYGVSKNVLKRLRRGYKRSDGVDVPPILFEWGHRNARNFDYSRAELDRVLKRQLIH